MKNGQKKTRKVGSALLQIGNSAEIVVDIFAPPPTKYRRRRNQRRKAVRN